MEIRYSKHFLERKTLRDFPEALAENVFLPADDHFYDAVTNTFIAVKRTLFPDTERDIALVYGRTGD